MDAPFDSTHLRGDSRDDNIIRGTVLREPHRPAFLAVNGALDEQVPIAELILLTQHGLTQPPRWTP